MELSNSDLLKQVQAALSQAAGDFAAVSDKAFKEAKSSGDMANETKASVDKIASEFHTLNRANDALKAQLGEIEQAVAANLGGVGQRAQILSAGAAVISSEALKAFAARVRGNERTSLSIAIEGPQAALTSTGVATGVVEPQRLTEIAVRPKQRLFIRDLIAPGRTTSPAIFWVQQTGFTNAAAVVAEGTKKPESAITFATKITPVTTVAHLFKTSKQIMDDFAQLQSTIDVEMRYGLKYAEEQEILFGDGTGVHLTGIIPQATAYVAVGIPSGATAIDSLRWAMLQSQLARVPATGHVLHYTDWAKIEMQKDTMGRYIIGNPQGVAQPTLWGLPVVPTEITAFLGKFLTGSFAYGAQLFDREDANVVISSENTDDFEKNMLTVRCEERLALAVKRPEAFIYGTLPIPV